MGSVKLARALARGGILALSAAVLASLLLPAVSEARSPAVVLTPGTPVLPLGNYDLHPLGYVVEEYFVSGTAQSYRLAAAATEDGRWRVVADASAPYVTRIVVVHRELIRHGDAYVAVSAQKVGIEGGGGVLGAGLPVLKQSNPARYAPLSHPGDAFSYDIFSQAGRLVKDLTSGILGPLATRG
jgi:hypothetical protein